MAEYIDRENLLKKLSRMIDYCKKRQQSKWIDCFVSSW